MTKERNKQHIIYALQSQRKERKEFNPDSSTDKNVKIVKSEDVIRIQIMTHPLVYASFK
jgi:hypothetical protein